MNNVLEDVISEFENLNPRKKTFSLPTQEQILELEEKIEKLDADYRSFLLKLSNIFYGYVSPINLNSNSPDYLPNVLKSAKQMGVPQGWLPIAQDEGNYFCYTPGGTIRYWDHNGANDESWPNLATWIKEVWIEGN